MEDEIAPDFTLDKVNYNTVRKQFEDEYPELVVELQEKEEKRRERKR